MELKEKEILELLLKKITDLEAGLKQVKENNLEMANGIKELKENIERAQLEHNQDVKSEIDDLNEDQKSIREILGDHEVAIRSLRRIIG
ncbi:hypothetical protein CHH61_03835 [Shouchella clausii]|uniref:Uncharacterized protein n=2 Tax=Shouchella clausii TaxID=79880 RepID=A0A268NWB0_SHOCL|nr:hypothetical protein CHH72_16855 [Shouchella clausii]PAF27361.1 hypothetical protein CHH61_03835 [Shouchella clausii]